MSEHLSATGLRAVVFDLDGVVVDSEPLHDRAQRIVFDRYGLAVPEALMPSFRGMVERDVFARIVRDFAPAPMDVAALVEAKNAAYRGLIDEMELVPGFDAFLRAAAARYAVALTTSSVRADQERAFARFGLGALFDVVVTAEDVARPKPDPEPYRVTAARLGLAPAACLVVEDSVNGVRSAAGAGCRVAGLTTSFDAATLRAAGAHVTVGTYADLARHLGLSLEG